MGNIVVGVDGSPPANRALRWALEEARRRGAAVVLVHAYRTPAEVRPHVRVSPYATAGMVQQRAGDDLRDREEQEERSRRRAEAVIERALEAVGGRPTDLVVRRVTVAHDPAKTLVEMSRAADLLVVGTRGRGGFTGLLLGSVSEACLRHGHCPVVTLR